MNDDKAMFDESTGAGRGRTTRTRAGRRARNCGVVSRLYALRGRMSSARSRTRRAGVAATVIVVALLAPTGAVDAHPSPPGDVIRAWNDLALDTVRVKSASDAVAARLYAMVNVAMYDAVNGLEPAPRRRTPALVAPRPGVSGDPVAAAAGAAHDVLASIYADDPVLVSRYDDQLRADLNRRPVEDSATRGRAWGGDVARAVVAARQNDGASEPENLAAGSGPGVFATVWKGTQFRKLQPFAIADPGAYVSEGPPALTSPEYAVAFNEVKRVGSSEGPDAEADARADETYSFWSLGGGTSQPPGAWLQVTEAVSVARSLPLFEAARLFALESMAMADTVAPTYSTKYRYRFWRPTAAIRQADPTTNPDTAPDPTWTSRAASLGQSAGSSPEHFSGHSTFSAAGATVLAGFFCQDQMSFTLTTDSAPGHEGRTYSSFSAAAAEAGRSRVLGGVHFEFSNQSALAAGRGIASEVLATSLLATTGPTHSRGCPM